MRKRAQRRFQFFAQMRGRCDSGLEVQAHWNGLNPGQIAIQLYEVDEELTSKETRVDNDRFVKVKHMDNRREFIQAARSNKIRAVADASFNREFSTEVAAAAWVLETKDGRFQWEGSGLMKAENNSSYGGELYGIYLILRFVQCMWDGNSGLQGKIKIKCDNITSIRDSMKKSLRMGSNHSFCSLNRAIRKHIKDLE